MPSEVENRLTEIGCNQELADTTMSFVNLIAEHLPALTALMNVQGIVKLYPDEVTIDWLFDTGYIIVKIREGDFRMESRTAEKRFVKSNPYPSGLLRALSEAHETLSTG